MGSTISKKVNHSPAYQFCLHMWQHNQEAQPGHSWLRINQAMHSALMLAVTGGLRFDLGDFNRIVHDFRSGYWIGASHEMFFTQAVGTSNMSACLSYENWQERKPFKIDGKRMFVGREIQWEGKKAKCTSITADYIIACAPKGWVGRGLKKRFDYTPARVFRITREMVKATKKQVQEAEAA